MLAGHTRPNKQLNTKSFFSSPRERCLWGWTLAVVAAIYSTLGWAPALAKFLRDRGLLDGLFVLGLILIGAAILTQALKVRAHGTEIGVALGIVATYLLVFVRMAIPEERAHLIEYGVVAIFVKEALTERASQGRRVPVPALLAILTTALVGLHCRIGAVRRRVRCPPGSHVYTCHYAAGAQTCASLKRPWPLEHRTGCQPLAISPKRNRKSQAVFHCVSCGLRMHADHNAAINILIHYLRTVARGTGATAR